MTPFCIRKQAIRRWCSPQRSRLCLIVRDLNGVKQRSSVDRDTIIRTLLDLDLHVEVELHGRLAAAHMHALQRRTRVRRQRRGRGAVHADAAAVLRPGRDANVEREGGGCRDVVGERRAERVECVDGH